MLSVISIHYYESKEHICTITHRGNGQTVNLALLVPRSHWYREFGIGSINNPLIHIFLYSHLLSGWYYIDILRRKSVCYSWEVKGFNWYSILVKHPDELQSQEYHCLWCCLHHKEILCFMIGNSNYICKIGQFNNISAWKHLPLHPCFCSSWLKAWTKIS